MRPPSSRLLSLLSLLQSRRDWPGPLLAERLGVSPRTVRRDVDRLRDLGYEVLARMGPDGGYCLGGGADLPPLLLDDDEAVAVAVALRVAAGGMGLDVGEAAGSALAKVARGMPSRLRRRVQDVDVEVLPGADLPTTAAATLLAVGAAARSREQLRFDYPVATGQVTGPDPTLRDGGTGGPARRRVEPHQILTVAGRWYLLAWDLDRGDWRTFRVDRMALCTTTGPPFSPRPVPGGDTARYVAARFHGHGDPDAPHRYACQGVATLRTPASAVAPYLAEGAVEALDGDRCRVVHSAWSWAALAASFARFDADIEAAAPVELVDAFAALARRAAAVCTTPAAPT